MANTSPFSKGPHSDPWFLGVKCASAITDTRLAYKLTTTDHETVELAGDNDPIAGFPDRLAAAGEAFNLVMAPGGHLEGKSSGASTITINQPLTAAAGGKLRVAVYGVDHVQFWAESNAAATDGAVVTVRKA